jgi:hypothetical protein
MGKGQIVATNDKMNSEDRQDVGEVKHFTYTMPRLTMVTHRTVVTHVKKKLTMIRKRMYLMRWKTGHQCCETHMAMTSKLMDTRRCSNGKKSTLKP